MKPANLKRTLAYSIALAMFGSTSVANAFESNPTPFPKSVVASAHDGNTPDRTLDGDIKTRWSANGDNVNMTFDYGQKVKLNAVKIGFHKGDERATKFDIEVSLDGNVWNKVITQKVSSGSSLELEQFDFPETDARYVRYIGFGNTSNSWTSVTEFISLNCNVDDCSTKDNQKVEPILPVAAETSGHDGNGPERLFDNDIKTRWSAEGDGSWVILDYGTKTQFDAVRLAFHKGDERATKFEIEVSEDGSNWSKVITSAQSSGQIAGYERFEFAPVTAQFVKYVGYGNTSNSWNSVTEFTALNCNLNACPMDHIITDEVIAKAKLAAELAKREVKHAGKTTSLDDWKITLPTTYTNYFGASASKASNPDGAAEIVPFNCSVDGSSLNKELKNDYFWADEKGWHFRTPLEGGATTPNATYIRTELREIAGDWKPCDGWDVANWAYGGTHTLSATLTLDEIPANPLSKSGKASAPKVVLGQIHAKDISAATVKLLWEGKTKPVRVILNKSTEKSAFSVSLGTIKDPSKPWSYQIKMTDDGIELMAGGVQKKLTFGKELSDDWKNETFYFKAGLYPQINKNSGGAFEATFSKLSILHSARPGDFGTHVPLVCDAAVSDCSCIVQDADCTWWDVPLPTPTLPSTPLATNKPGQNFDLTGWYLSQPFDHDMNGKPDDVFEWHLAQGYEHPEMFYTAGDGGLVFKSFNKGVRTSQNTKYVRTELREMLRAGDRSIPLQGVNKNNWVFSSAPVEDQIAAGGIDGILEATLKIDHTTTTGEANQVGRFIIGQIHDKDDEPIRLYYRKLPSQDTGTVYFAHENTLKGTDTYFDLVGGMDGVIDDGIALGEVFSYRIEVVGNTMTVTLMREGKDDAVQVVDMSQSGYDQGGRYMYFKAGVYNQNNTGDPEDYVQATFYKLEKSHNQYQEK